MIANLINNSQLMVGRTTARLPKMSRHAFFIGSVLLLLASTQAANILGIFSSPSPSHFIVNMSVMKALADRGHNITIATAVKSKIIHENITEVFIPPSEKHVAIFQNSVKEMANKKGSLLTIIYKLFVAEMLDGQYDFTVHPKMKNLYETNNANFDLVIYGYFLNEFQMGIAAKLNVPVIVNWIGVPLEGVDSLVGNINDPAYVPGVGTVPDPEQRAMNFWQRVRNHLTWVFFKTMNYVAKWRNINYYNRVFGNDPNMPSFTEMKRRISLLFTNYHSHSEGLVRPQALQSIEIGGIQIKEQPDPLPSELAEFLDNAKDGAIFFSLGTNLKESFIKPHTISAIFNVLSRLPQRVVWKVTDQNKLPGKSANILFKEWLPQDDILAHPNIKLFITHAGKGSLAESQYHGVPMLALPVFGDQPSNANVMSTLGFGVTMDILTLTEQNFLDNINEVLNNPIYLEKVRKFSELYRDRPMTARQSVVYWTEYVLRHKGAYNLQCPWLHLNPIERNNIDVYAFLLVISCSTFWLLKLITKAAWRGIVGQSMPSKKKLKNSAGKVKKN